MASSGFKGFGSCEQLLLQVERLAIDPVTDVLNLLLGDVDLSAWSSADVRTPPVEWRSLVRHLSGLSHGRVSSFLLPTMLDVFAPDASSIASSPQSAGSSSPIGESSLLTQ